MAALDLAIRAFPAANGLKIGGILKENPLKDVQMTNTPEPEFIETTAGQIAAELTRRGIPPDQPITVAIHPADWLTEVRQFARPRVIAQGWSDADIDRIIDEERDHVQPLLE
jgi:hypothetical protein